jgi:hypothetical protein
MKTNTYVSSRNRKKTNVSRIESSKMCSSVPQVVAADLGADGRPNSLSDQEDDIRLFGIWTCDGDHPDGPSGSWTEKVEKENKMLDEGSSNMASMDLSIASPQRREVKMPPLTAKGLSSSLTGMTTFKHLANLVVLLFVVVWTGEALSSDVMGNGLNEARESTDCIGVCFGSRELSIEAYLGNAREVFRLTKDAAEWNKNRMYPSDRDFETLKKGIKCYRDDPNGLYLTDHRVKDVRFFADVSDYTQYIANEKSYTVDKNKIQMGSMPYRGQSDLRTFDTKYYVGNSNEILEVQRLKNRHTGDIEVINYRISQCERTYLFKDIQPIAFGTSMHNVVSHINSTSEINVVFDGPNGTGAHYFTSRVRRAGDAYHLMGIDLANSHNDEIWAHQVRKAFTNLRMNDDSLEKIDESIEDIFLLLLTKYGSEGLDKKEVLRRARLAIKKSWDLRSIEKLINQVF